MTETTKLKSDERENKREVEVLAARFEKAAPEEVLSWALQEFGSRVALAIASETKVG